MTALHVKSPEYKLLSKLKFATAMAHCQTHGNTITSVFWSSRRRKPMHFNGWYENTWEYSWGLPLPCRSEWGGAKGSWLLSTFFAYIFLFFIHSWSRKVEKHCHYQCFSHGTCFGRIKCTKLMSSTRRSQVTKLYWSNREHFSVLTQMVW